MNPLVKLMIESLSEGQDLEGKCTDTLLISKEGKVLLLKRPDTDDLFPNQWCLPGGHRQDDETIKAGAQREAQEETGIATSDLKLIRNWTYPDGFQTTFFYGIEGEDFYDTKVTLSDEHVDYIWAEPEQALRLNLSGSLREPLSKIFAELFA